MGLEFVPPSPGGPMSAANAVQYDRDNNNATASRVCGKTQLVVFNFRPSTPVYDALRNLTTRGGRSGSHIAFRINAWTLADSTLIVKTKIFSLA